MKERVEFDAHKSGQQGDESCVQDEVRRKGSLYCREADQGACSTLIQCQGEQLSIG